MIEYLLQPNLITGWPAIILGFLVMRAFWPYAFQLRMTAVGHLGAALFWLTGRSVGRSIWWDVFEGFGLGISTNWIWNALGIIACYHALKGFYLLLPDADRGDYNMLTAAFYPRRLWRRLRDKDEIG